MVAEIAPKLTVFAVEQEAPVRDPVGIGDQREAGHRQRIGAAVGRTAQQIDAVIGQPAQRSARVGRERRFQRARPQDDRLVAQPTISSSSRPLVSCTILRTKKKEIAANSAYPV